MQLVPCPSCARHVKSSESACPFCSSALSGAMMKRTPSAQRRLERLAAFTFAATLAVTGCAVAGDESDTDKSEQEIGGIHAMYGMPPPPVDAGPPPAEDAGPAPCTTDNDDEDHGGFAALYGMPSFPPSLPPPCPTEDAGAPPPPPTFDGGGFHAMYGMPPAPRD
ncbi:MAG: hypothetical protein KIT84_24810 [Labilithrix sp.]|nr:hypothetical protein [Labilithrix sp.]MCW5814272.1 hypothetical protein [Labilithrix sp.]